MVFDNGKVIYAENEKSPSDVDVSRKLLIWVYDTDKPVGVGR